MDKKTPNSDLIELVEKLLNEALKKKKKAEKKSKDEDKDEKKADKDYDGDGEVESSKDEYFGSKDKAIKKAMGKKEIVSKKKKKKLEEGRLVGNEQLIYGGFPRVISVVLNEENPAITPVPGSQEELADLRAQLEQLQAIRDQSIDATSRHWINTVAGREHMTKESELQRAIINHPVQIASYRASLPVAREPLPSEDRPERRMPDPYHGSDSNLRPEIEFVKGIPLNRKPSTN